jgi:hypothetical protein
MQRNILFSEICIKFFAEQKIQLVTVVFKA